MITGPNTMENNQMGKGNNLAPTIDRLGVIKALQADLKNEEAELKAVLVSQGEGAYEGENFRATISMVTREGFDEVYKARVDELVEKHISRQFAQAHAVVSVTPTLRVTARTGKSKVAA